MNTAILPDEPARVSERHASNWQIEYTVTGGRAAVDEAIRRIRNSYPAAGYGTSFTEPRETTPGCYEARGWRAATCN